MIVTLSKKSLSTRAAHMPAKLPPITRALVEGMASFANVDLAARHYVRAARTDWAAFRSGVSSPSVNEA